jgi:hypothetical protein
MNVVSTIAVAFSAAEILRLIARVTSNQRARSRAKAQLARLMQPCPIPVAAPTMVSLDQKPRATEEIVPLRSDPQFVDSSSEQLV